MHITGTTQSEMPTIFGAADSSRFHMAIFVSIHTSLMSLNFAGEKERLEVSSPFTIVESRTKVLQQ